MHRPINKPLSAVVVFQKSDIKNKLNKLAALLLCPTRPLSIKLASRLSRSPGNQSLSDFIALISLFIHPSFFPSHLAATFRVVIDFLNELSMSWNLSLAPSLVGWLVNTGADAFAASPRDQSLQAGLVQISGRPDGFLLARGRQNEICRIFYNGHTNSSTDLRLL